MRILIAGASGFLGQALKHHFVEARHQVIELSHASKQGVYFWNPQSHEIDLEACKDVDVAINLSGETLLGHWTKKKIERIENSRVLSTQFLSSTLYSMPSLPKVYINASATGYYGDCSDTLLTEAQGVGTTFLAKLCQSWEQAAENLTNSATRIIYLRLGVILEADGGILKKMRQLFRLGLGGTLGSGKQWMSWIAMEDVIRAVDHLIFSSDLSGPINCVSPGPVTNKEFTQTLAHLLRRSACMHVPKWVLQALFGKGAKVYLASTRVYPQRLLQSGFEFHYPTLALALKKYLQNK